MKTRKMKRFATIAAIAMIASCVAMPMAAFADDPTTYSITINDEASGHTYEAYQIFAGSLNEDGVLGDIVWGDGVDTTKTVGGKTLVQAIQAISVGNPATTPFNGKEEADDIAKVLSDEQVGFDADITKAFAAVVGKYLKTVAGSDDFDEDKYVIPNLSAGYYLVKDKDNTLGSVNDSYTRYILKVVADEEVTPKGELPTVQKKVWENTKDITGQANYETAQNSKWNDVADYNIGDMVPFKLYADMPSNIGDYEHYYIKFTDELASQFTVGNDTTYTIKVNGTEVAANPWNIHVKKTGNTIITIEIEDVYALTSKETGDPITVNGTSVITVEYEAELNDSAEIGLDGQENSVYLEYSNNPNVEYTPTTDGPTSNEDTDSDGELDEDQEYESETPDEENEDNTGKTKPDVVIVFTYEMDVTKYLGDKSTTADAEDGTKAGFKLQAKDGEHANKWAKVNSEFEITEWVDEENADEVYTTSNGTLKFVGLDDGTYVLRETTTPKGYNTMVDLEVTVAASTANCQTYKEDPDTMEADDVLTLLKSVYDGKEYAGDLEDGTAPVSIVNLKGSTLPGTGGIGTTIFYVVGGTMAAGAGVYLISKKRMKKEQD